MPDIDADLDLGPEPVDPATLLPTLEEAELFYASSGIWQLPPEAPSGAEPDSGQDIYLASLDPVIASVDALALPVPRLAAGPDRPRGFPPPAPFGTTFELGPDGLVVPTPEGALTPDGVRVIAGRPPVLPRPREGGEEIATAPDAPVATDPRLASFQPTPRPDDLIERRERQILGGFTLTELAARRPQARPPSVQQLAQQARAAEAAAAAAAEAVAQSREAGAEATVVEISASDLAVGRSLVPRSRPSDIAEIVARVVATRTAAAQSGGSAGPAAGASTAAVRTAAAPAPATAAPSIPSNASVTRAATVRNGINLHRVNLIGVTGTPSDRRALVRLPSGRFVTVGVGDRVDGGRVAAIGQRSLQYVKNGRNITLEVPSG